MTTRGRDGGVNCAAMGVRWGTDEVVFWPFHGTRTLRNLRFRGEAVAHLTDDVLLFVQAALGHPHPATRPAEAIRGAVIEQCSAWRELVVTEITATGERAAARTGHGARGRVRVRDAAADGHLPRPPRRGRGIDRRVPAALARRRTGRRRTGSAAGAGRQDRRSA